MSLWSFIHEVRHQDLPPATLTQVRRCLLDLIGVAAAGSAMPAARIARDFACEQFGPGRFGARLLFDARRASPAGAALAGAATIDSLAAHDGHPLARGHAGAALLPALLAYADGGCGISGREVLTSLVMGYEVAIRAALALHQSAPGQHASGAWNALGAAALGARLLALDRERTREALGIAEFHAPASPRMRCVEHPAMVRDGSGWGAMAGVGAAYLAQAGFTGGPALAVEAPEAATIWSDLGERWRILELYFKPHAVSRWAQPAVEAALALQQACGLESREIIRVQVSSFHQAVRLATREPRNTDQAQYSLPFAVAAALVRGRLGVGEITADGLDDPEIRRLSANMALTETAVYNARFPGERWAHVHFGLKDGRVLRSEPCVARGGFENPLSDAQLLDKYRALALPALGQKRSEALRREVESLDDDGANVERFLDLLLAAPPAGP